MRPTPAGPRRRSRRVLVIITLLAITLITIDSAGGNTFDPVRNVASDVFSPVGDALRWVSTPFRNAWAGITGYDEIQKENSALRDEITELRAERITDDNIREQYERLRDALDVGTAGNIPFEVARVAAGPRSNFTDHRMEIDKGSASGLEVGMPVLAGEGLIGRLVRVSSNRAVVQLITDPSLRVGVRLADTQVRGVGHGSGATGPFVVNTGIELSADVSENEGVLTSGLDRAIFPPDQVVGFVEEIEPDEAAQSLILRVEFAASFSEIDVVKVLKWVPST
ncbi:MAG: rod shape-determining protein MreC [Microthrixaceae bacterium]